MCDLPMMPHGPLQGPVFELDNHKFKCQDFVGIVLFNRVRCQRNLDIYYISVRHSHKCIVLNAI
jgi:hypothetical protein